MLAEEVALKLAGYSRVAQLAASCVSSIRNLRLTFNCPNDLNLGMSVHSKFLVPAAPSFCEAGPPATKTNPS